MSIFTERDFNMLAQGYLLKDILKDHIENYGEVYKFYTAFIKDWNNSVDDRMSFLRYMNSCHIAQGEHNIFKVSTCHASLEVIVKKSVYNLPTIPLIKDTTPREDFTNTYPDCKDELISAIVRYFVSCECNWDLFIDKWNTSILSSTDRMYIEFPLTNIPGSNLTLSFPKKFLIGDYDD